MAPRKWIDRNKATTYKLVHRAQNDPLIHDAGASDMVFQELLAPQTAKKAGGGVATTLSDLDSELRSRAGDYDDDDDDGFHMRDNEGEAAEHGVYYDDTEYDYMQHLRDLGGSGADGAAGGGGESFFVEAVPVTVKGKGKSKGKDKVSLDEALRQLDLAHEGGEQQSSASASAADGGDGGRLTDQAILPSKNLRHVTYQDQQDVPDALAGFQPDMDPRLREALEALEDEEYVDNDDQDLFDELAKGGEEIELDEFEEYWPEEYEDEDGWESDDTARPAKGMDGEEEEDGGDDGNDTDGGVPLDGSAEASSKETPLATTSTPGSLPPSDAAIPDAPSDPLAAFHAHKAQVKPGGRPKAAAGAGSAASAIRDSRMHGGAAASTVMSSASFMSGSGRRRRRKGALTDPSSFSMTSSALHRTEGLTLLDARFDRILEAEYEGEEEEEEEDYDDDEGDGTASVATGVTGGAQSMASGMSAASAARSTVSSVSSKSQAPDLVRRNYDGVMGMMDDFLGAYAGGPAQPGDSRKNVNTRKGGGGGSKSRRGYGGQTGMQQLDEIRRELGRPRLAGVR